MSTETERMLEDIVEHYNQKWKAAGGGNVITSEEAIEILIEDAYYSMHGNEYSYNELCAEREKFKE